MATAEKKIGVYICTGCKIGESLDIEALEKVITSEGKIPLCKKHEFLCGGEGAELIKNDITQESLDMVLIAACSPREKQEVFTYDPSIVMERVNLREHVVWSHPANDEDTQMLAEDYLRMYMAKIKKTAAPEPHIPDEISTAILVVGGGITGLAAAIEGARAGREIILVEKSGALGGRMATYRKQLPRKNPFETAENPDISQLIREVDEQDNIKVHLSTKIEKISGGPGMFEVSLAKNGSSEQVKVGAVVEAAGWIPYEAKKLGHLGYGKFQNVITSVMLEEQALNGKITRPSDGEMARNVLFIQCAGSRDPKHLPYCSSVCCMTSLKQAQYIREQDPNARVYIVYKDMRTPGLYENFYKKVQEDEGIFLTKGDVGTLTEDENQNILVEVDNTLLGEKIQVNSDLVVLATGMVPRTALELKELETEESDACSDEEKKEEDAPPPDQIIPSDILNLDYRQGPELPGLMYGFPDSHYICFPYESRRTGIYPAGCVRAPLDSAGCIEDATGAMLKAIQCIDLTSHGKATFPRTGDMTFPDLFMQRCTQCKRCTEECPFGTYNEDEKANPIPFLTRCRRCGICMGSCPERIISFKNFSVDIVGSMVKAIDVPDEDEEKPRAIAFLCENDAYPCMDLAAKKRLTYNPYIRVIPLRCLGNLNLVWVADSLSKGIDGILLIGCKYGDDYQCHYMKGSELANYRMGKIQETLDRLVLESERIRLHQLSIDEYDQLPAIFDEFLEKLEEVGPNPYKGF